MLWVHACPDVAFVKYTEIVRDGAIFLNPEEPVSRYVSTFEPQLSVSNSHDRSGPYPASRFIDFVTSQNFFKAHGHPAGGMSGPLSPVLNVRQNCRDSFTTIFQIAIFSSSWVMPRSGFQSASGFQIRYLSA